MACIRAKCPDIIKYPTVDNSRLSGNCPVIYNIKQLQLSFKFVLRLKGSLLIVMYMIAT
jgi:hypothetical protein